MQERSFFALAVSWLTTTGSIVTNHISNTISIACGIASLVASVIAIFASLETLRIRRLQRVDEIAKLCRQCQEGKPPSTCPLGEERPENCPLKGLA